MAKGVSAQSIFDIASLARETVLDLHE